MIVSCESCGIDFLTESDPHVVRPTPRGNKLYCYCHIKGFDEVENKIKELQAENLRLSTIVNNQKIVIEINQAKNAKLRECLGFYADTSNWYAVDCDPLYRSSHDVDGIIDFSDIEDTSHGTEIRYGGKRARQVLKELEKNERAY